VPVSHLASGASAAVAAVLATWICVAAGADIALAAPVGAVAGAGVAAGIAWRGRRGTRGGSRDDQRNRRVNAARTLPIGVGRGLLEQLPLGLLLLDRRGQVIFENTAAGDVLERATTGMHFSAVLRAPTLTEAITTALRDGAAAEVDVTLLRSKEREIHAHILPVGETLSNGPADAAWPSVMILFEDRTRMVKAEALRRDFVANASHELKTPLAAIAGFIETLQGHAREDPEATARFLAIMARQAERMKRLVEDLLSLNRIEINEHVRPRDSVDLGSLVREAAAALSPIIAAEGARVDLRLPDAGPVVRGSHDELGQVFVNLIDNAVKYAGRDGPILITLADGADAPPGMVGVSVADSGPGIAREHLPRLTERFYRVSAARSRERGGTGLGLAIVKHILNRHRGDLAIASVPGEGARFTVWLPALAQPDDSQG